LMRRRLKRKLATMLTTDCVCYTLLRLIGHTE